LPGQLPRSLRLNEDLTEAIALGHDLGHTPFGHAGEEVLNELLPGGFHHSEQSLRVVDKLEYDGKGLNLSFEVRDGILKHSKGRGEILNDDPEGSRPLWKVKLCGSPMLSLMSITILMMP